MLTLSFLPRLSGASRILLKMQKVVERLDNLHDEILAGKNQGFTEKIGGIVITGDSDAEVST